MPSILEQIERQFSKLTGFNFEDPRVALHRKTRRKIKEINYPIHHGFHEEYRHHLAHLNIGDLHDYLAWIPYDRLVDVQILHKGPLATVHTAVLPSIREEGFAIVKKGKFHSFDGKKEKRVVLKELDDELIQELVVSEVSICNSEWPLTMELIGLTRNPATGRYLVVTEQASDGNLTSYITCNPPKDWDEVYQHIFTLAKRLASLHHLGYMHGNLHAGNVVFHEGEPYLLDIDIAPLHGEHHRGPHMPPEIITGSDYAPSADVYCFGTLAWQIIAGGARPHGDSVDTGRDDKLREEYVPGCPRGLWNIVVKCWHPDPEVRLTMQQVCVRLYYWRVEREWTSWGRWKVMSEETVDFVNKRLADDSQTVVLEGGGDGVIVGGFDVADSFIHVGDGRDGANSRSGVLNNPSTRAKGKRAFERLVIFALSSDLHNVGKQKHTTNLVTTPLPSIHLGRRKHVPLLIPIAPNLNHLIRVLLPRDPSRCRLVSWLLFPFIAALVSPFGYANANTFFPRRLIPDAPFPDAAHADHMTVHHTLPRQYLAYTPGPRVSYAIGIAVYMSGMKAVIPRNEMSPTAELLILDFVHGLRKPRKRRIDVGVRIFGLYLKWRLLGLIFQKYRVFGIPLHGDQRSLDALIIGFAAAVAHASVGELDLVYVYLNKLTPLKLAIKVPSQKHDVFVPSRGVSVDDWGPMVNKVVLWARDDQDVFDF
ncbi:kinase-like domain-containing protein [Jimgerdemannia flammicorona]|uniref:Kinase-like domain-containing protein n=1 Tax=Jimgerdemannia flammicorona TaxID=994334 RepID=A0A433DEH6_9FUNG|nr:kinase-like domain-containing protein [Jimgerdemannia flammicorona]